PDGWRPDHERAQRERRDRADGWSVGRGALAPCTARIEVHGLPHRSVRWVPRRVRRSVRPGARQREEHRRLLRASLGSVGEQLFPGLHVGGLGRVGDGWGLRFEAAGRFNPLGIFTELHYGLWMRM